MNHTNSNHLTLVYEAAKQYKNTAALLMSDLCQQASIDINSAERNADLRKKYGKQKEHAMSFRWIFCLHGAEVRFTNVDDDREIEVIATNGIDFGVLDCYFFISFCEQREPYKSIATIYQKNPDRFDTDMNELIFLGKLRKLDPALQETNRNVTA